MCDGICGVGMCVGWRGSFCVGGGAGVRGRLLVCGGVCGVGWVSVGLLVCGAMGRGW